MRGTLLYFNGLLVIISAGFFAYTWLAKSHVEAAAHDYVMTTTIEYGLPLAREAEKLLDNKFVRAALNARQEEAIRSELVRMRTSPRPYLEELVDRNQAKAVANEAFNEKFTAWKKPVVEYYERTLARALLHVRVFALTNIVAACLACVAAYVSRTRIYAELLVISAVLFFAVLFSSLQFFDDETYFRILTNSASLTAYPLALIAMFALLYSHLQPALRKVAEIDATIGPGK